MNINYPIIQAPMAGGPTTPELVAAVSNSGGLGALRAGGGIMDGRGLVAALSLGALGAQLGTAFLISAECGAHPAHKEALLKATADRTALTRAFSGKLARGLQNRFITEMQPYEAMAPGYPIQNALTRDMRQAAARQNRPDFTSLGAGQGVGLSAAKPAAEIMAGLIAQADSILDRLSRVVPGD